MRRPVPDRDLRLAAVSAAQLAAGIGGLAIALKRRHAYDFLVLHGRADTIRRDSILMGSALSAPAPTLAIHSVAIARIWRGARGGERRVLGALGAAMVVGYLGESH